MSAKWAATLAPGSAVHDEFKGLLASRIEQDFEPEEELVNCVLQALLEVQDRQALNAELLEVFEDASEAISDWCWENLERLTARQNQPSEPETAAATAAEEPAQEQQEQQQHKRAPIQFSLEASAPETIPKKASDSKAQQLGTRKQAAPPEPAPAKQVPQAQKQPPPAAPAAAPAAAQQPTKADEQHARSSGSGRQARGAPAASARLLHMTGLIRPADGGSRERDSRQPRGRQLQPVRPEQQPRGIDGSSRSPQQQQQQRKRGLEEGEVAEQSRPAPGARRGPASAVVGPGSMFRSAMDGLKTERGSAGSSRAQGQPTPGSPAQQQQQQQQQQGGATSVFARIHKDDLARIGVPQALAQQGTARQAPPQQQQQQQRSPGLIEGLPKSLQGRLGIAAGRQPPAAAPAAQQGAGRQPDRAQPPAAAAVGGKRKAADAAAADAGPTAAAAAVTAGVQGVTPPAGAAGAAEQQGGAPAGKKTRSTVAAPAAAGAAAPAGAGGGGKAPLSSKAAELAALRAQLEARQAEVQRLKQAQEVDAVSVAVFGVPPHLPDSVLLAHFASCAKGCGAGIKRCTLLAGRFPPHVSAPGAYIEFEGLGPGDAAARARAAAQATANALQLSGSMLLDQKITVLRKADWQANQAKGQRAYTAMRAGAAQPTGSAVNRSWKGPSSSSAAPAASGAAPAGVAES